MEIVVPIEREISSKYNELKTQKLIDTKEQTRPKGRPRKSEEEKKAARRAYEQEYYKKNAKHLSETHKRWYTERMKLYAAFVENLKEENSQDPENYNENFTDCTYNKNLTNQELRT